MMNETRYFRVRGRVQGVGFRAATRNAARELGIAGWVRNRVDGDVELMAHGEAQDLDALRDWLNRGPDTARVGEIFEQPSEQADLPSPFAVT